MKNAEELFEKYELKAPCFNEEGIQISEDDTDCIFYDDFLKALSEHDQELIKEIEKKMEKESQQKSKQNRIFHQGRYDLLTEIINLIKEK